jgi:hypothetical protein
MRGWIGRVGLLVMADTLGFMELVLSNGVGYTLAQQRHVCRRMV